MQGSGDNVWVRQGLPAEKAMKESDTRAKQGPDCEGLCKPALKF